MAAKKKNPVKDELVGFLRELWKDAKENVLDHVRHQMQLRLQEAYARFIGKSVAIIGPPEAGKTTLLNVLRDPLIEPEKLRVYTKTEMDSYKSFTVRINLPVSNGKQIRFRFKIRKNADVGGEEYLRDPHWSNAIKGAAVVVYVADAVRLFQPGLNEYRSRIIADFDWIFDHLQLLEPSFAVVLAVNKVDLFCDRQTYRNFANTHATKLIQLQDEIAARWPDHYRGNFKGIPVLSLMDLGLRNFTLTDLVASFAGESFLQLYRQSPNAGANNEI